MRYQKRLAMAMTILFVAVLISATGFLVVEADHHCEDHSHCGICQEIQICQNILSGKTMTLIVAVFLVVLCPIQVIWKLHTSGFSRNTTLFEQGILLTI